jgi:hypothetical protein
MGIGRERRGVMIKKRERRGNVMARPVFGEVYNIKISEKDKRRQRCKIIRELCFFTRLF